MTPSHCRWGWCSSNWTKIIYLVWKGQHFRRLSPNLDDFSASSWSLERLWIRAPLLLPILGSSKDIWNTTGFLGFDFLFAKRPLNCRPLSCVREQLCPATKIIWPSNRLNDLMQSLIYKLSFKENAARRSYSPVFEFLANHLQPWFLFQEIPCLQTERKQRLWKPQSEVNLSEGQEWRESVSHFSSHLHTSVIDIDICGNANCDPLMKISE